MTEDIWIAIDFETATPARDSACSLGVAIIENGILTGSRAWLIKPPGNRYHGRNIEIHGIHPGQTAGSPTFAELYPELLPYLDGRHLIAHSASFDISVLRSCLFLYGLRFPKVRYICSCHMARRAYPQLVNHQLPTVCRHCEIPLNHHEAGSDAHAAALVALSCRDQVGASTVRDAVRRLGVPIRIL